MRKNVFFFLLKENKHLWTILFEHLIKFSENRRRKKIQEIESKLCVMHFCIVLEVSIIQKVAPLSFMDSQKKSPYSIIFFGFRKFEYSKNIPIPLLLLLLGVLERSSLYQNLTMYYRPLWAVQLFV